MIHNIIKTISRKLIMLLAFFFPEQKKITLERRLRGREEFWKLSRADCVIVSFGKSGRTWLRVMLSRFYQLKYGLSQKSLLGFDNLHRKNPAIPRVFFTHDNYIGDYTGQRESKADFYSKKVILMVRDPRDVAVSQFFQWKYRMKPGKKTINDYPRDDVPIFEFVTRPDAGLPKVIDFMNRWAAEIPRLKDLLVVRYEDMRARPEETLRDILEFMGTPGTAEQIKEAVAFASYDNMKTLEQKKVFWLSGGRLLPRDRGNPDSYKVRRAKVGGYQDYFEERQRIELDRLVAATLAPVFDYGGEGAQRLPNSQDANSRVSQGITR